MINLHHYEGQQHLQNRKPRIISIKEIRKRHAQHIMSHGYGHKEQKKNNGQQQPAFQFRSFPVL